MDEYPSSLRATVLHALELADAEDRYPVAAMLADICAMLERDEGAPTRSSVANIPLDR